jgi:hypothetical protein
MRRSLRGEKGVVDIIGVMGWYQMVSMLLNVDHIRWPMGRRRSWRAI